MRGLAVVAAGSVLAALAGCSSMSEGKFSTRRLETNSFAAAYEAALRATRESFQIIEQDEQRGLIRTRPQRDVDKPDAGSERTLGEVVAPRKQNIRRTATVVVRRMGEGVLAEAQVRRERLDSDVLRSQHPQGRGYSDAGTETPIDRGAAADDQQQAHWTDVGRDRAMEARLLARISDHVREMEGRQQPATTRAAE